MVFTDSLVRSVPQGLVHHFDVGILALSVEQVRGNAPLVLFGGRIVSRIQIQDSVAADIHFQLEIMVQDVSFLSQSADA